MQTVELSPGQQHALRSLAASDPVPGTPLPDGVVLRHILTLLGCDRVQVTLLDAHGGLVDGVSLPPGTGCRERHQRDTLVLGFRSGTCHVVRMTLQRRRRPFSESDVAVLRLVEPLVGRLFRERPSAHLPRDLTAQERRVLQLVATGRSNAEIAERMGIAPSTVRKHLEHAFPKLGVSNRLAAARAFEAELRPQIFA